MLVAGAVGWFDAECSVPPVTQGELGVLLLYFPLLQLQVDSRCPEGLPPTDQPLVPDLAVVDLEPLQHAPKTAASEELQQEQSHLSAKQL